MPQLEADLFLTDGGLETTLIFEDGLDLPDFAAFVLLQDPDGRAALVRYFDRYAEIARRDDLGVVLETPTWRANPDWAERLGYSPSALDAANRDAVHLLHEIRGRWQTPGSPVVISGCLGPRGDGYVVDSAMTAGQAQEYHAPQIRSLRAAGADLVSGLTMTYSAEATGLAAAARAEGIPAVISFTVEIDGLLPSGESLAESIETVDAATDSYPAYYMVNCAHPSHFAHVLAADAPWTQRIRGLRANASRLSHAELDEAEDLDGGDPVELAQDYAELRADLPHLSVLGGCCGTNHEHVSAISLAALAGR
ncbi:homocysteine S-methyltransferase family protein [Nocardioides sp.]|uniref:homocysteine S-methyltransferase family protein n=1 Tax=Nocardioides sp. TaxID=35761 RepID=UPI003D0C599F